MKLRYRNIFRRNKKILLTFELESSFFLNFIYLFFGGGCFVNFLFFLGWKLPTFTIWWFFTAFDSDKKFLYVQNDEIRIFCDCFELNFFLGLGLPHFTMVIFLCIRFGREVDSPMRKKNCYENKIVSVNFSFCHMSKKKFEPFILHF